MPKWIQTPDSSNVKKFTYDNNAMELTVAFKKGHVYKYLKVDVGIYLGLKQAESKGKYIHENLVDKFEFVQIK